MTCRYCEGKGATTEVYPGNFTVSRAAPSCAFKGDVFSADNWNCGTMNRLREMVTDPVWSEDQWAGVVGHDGKFILLGWYKSRGRTEFARYLREVYADPLSLTEAYEFIDGKECKS